MKHLGDSIKPVKPKPKPKKRNKVKKLYLTCKEPVGVMIKQLLSSYKFKPRRRMNHKKSNKTEADVPKRKNVEIGVRKE